MKSRHQLRVEEFLSRAGQPFRSKPGIPTRSELLMQLSLIAEEFNELLVACGFLPTLVDDRVCVAPRSAGEFDLVTAVDGCCDLNVVVTGLMCKMGVADAEVQEVVDNNNLAKFGPGGHRDPFTGKWIKPIGHKPPDIEGVLRAQGWEESHELPSVRT